MALKHRLPYHTALPGLVSAVSTKAQPPASPHKSGENSPFFAYFPTLMPHSPSFCLNSPPFASFPHHLTAARGAPTLGTPRRFPADPKLNHFSPFSPFPVQSLTGKNDITPFLVTRSFYFFHQSREEGAQAGLRAMRGRARHLTAGWGRVPRGGSRALPAPRPRSPQAAPRPSPADVTAPLPPQRRLPLPLLSGIAPAAPLRQSAHSSLCD